jgi:hypothetical protein
MEDASASPVSLSSKVDPRVWMVMAVELRECRPSARSGSWRRDLRLVLVLALRIGAIVEGIDGVGVRFRLFVMAAGAREKRVMGA